nr:hypothetical protein [Tanacetum cinerariifolium]
MLHGIWRFDGHPSMMIGFLRNIEGIGPHIRYLRYANSLLVRNMSKYSTPTPSVVVLPSSLGSSLRESSFFLIISINMTSPSSPFMQTTLESLCFSEWIVTALIEPWIWVEHYGSIFRNGSGSNRLGVTKIVLIGLESIPLTSRFIGTRGYIFNKGLFGIFHAILSVVRTTTDLDEVMKLTTGRLVNGSSCNWIDMVIRNLDFEPKVIIAEFCGPSWWKGLSKETSSKILPFGDGSCRMAFKPISSLIAKGKLK